MSTVPVPAPPLPVSANAQGRNWGSGRPRPRQIHEWNGISDVVAQLHSLESTTATPQVSACQTHPVPLGSRLAATDTRRLVCNSATSHSLVALPMPNDSHYHASLDARAGDQPSYRAEEIKRSRAEELERSRAEDVERSPTDSGSSGSIQSSSHGRPHHDNRRGAHSADESERPAGTGDNKVSATGDGSQTSPRPRRTRALMTRLQGDSLNKLWDHTMFPSTSERESLAPRIGLTARQVQVWFQNQRQKRRRERESDEAMASSVAASAAVVQTEHNRDRRREAYLPYDDAHWQRGHVPDGHPSSLRYPQRHSEPSSSPRYARDHMFTPSPILMPSGPGPQVFCPPYVSRSPTKSHFARPESQPTGYQRPSVEDETHYRSAPSRDERSPQYGWEHAERHDRTHFAGPVREHSASRGGYRRVFSTWPYSRQTSSSSWSPPDQGRNGLTRPHIGRSHTLEERGPHERVVHDRYGHQHERSPGSSSHTPRLPQPFSSRDNLGDELPRLPPLTSPRITHLDAESSPRHRGDQRDSFAPRRRDSERKNGVPQPTAAPANIARLLN